MPERFDETRHPKFDADDRTRAIEILQEHYSPENVLLTAPTLIQIYRQRTERYETWEVVLWNVKLGEFIAWRRDGGLKAKPLVPDEQGLVGGVHIPVPGEQAVFPVARAVARDDGDELENDPIAQELAKQYLQRIERQLTDPRRGTLDPYAGSVGEALRDIEESLREQERQRAADRGKPPTDE